MYITYGIHDEIYSKHLNAYGVMRKFILEFTFSIYVLNYISTFRNAPASHMLVAPICVPDIFSVVDGRLA